MDADVEMMMKEDEKPQWTTSTNDGYEYEEDGGGDDAKRAWSDSDTNNVAMNSMPKSTRVLIENLPHKMQWQALKDLIKEHVSPEIDCFVDLIKDSDGRYTGEGLVNFNKIEVAARAIDKLNGLQLEGRELVVREETDPPSRKRRRSRSNSPNSQSKKILISNIPYSTTWQQLKDFFREKIGPVDYAEVNVTPDGVSKGTGIVSFHEVGKAKEAIEKMNNSEFLGRKIHVREEKERNRQMSNNTTGAGIIHAVNIDQRLLQYLGVNEAPTNTVYVGNLETNTQWQKLKDIFRIAGNVGHVKIMTDIDGKQRGFALIQFESTFDALQSISMLNGCELFGRPMYVRMYTDTLDRLMNSGHRQHPDLPSGLGRVGMNLQNLQSRLQGNVMGGGGMGAAMGGSMGGAGMGSMGDLAGMAYMIQSLFSGGATTGGYNNTGGAGGGYSGTPGGGYSGAPGGGYNMGHQNQRMTQDPSRPTCTVCVENLDRSVTWQALKDRFKPIGNVQFADLIKQGGRMTGCGLVKFSTSDDAERAVRLMNGVKFEGKTLSVYLDN